MNKDIDNYNSQQSEQDREICRFLNDQINKGLPNAESKIWHGSPVWFLEGNPVAGYSKLKNRVRLMFWSGADFDEQKLDLGSGKFKDAHVDYTDINQLDSDEIQRWLAKSRDIQWDYKNIVKNRGLLHKLK